MPKKSAIVPCVDCQEMFPGTELNRRGRCAECALAAMLENARQLTDGKGKWYEHWKAACLHNAKRYAAGVRQVRDD